MKQFGCVGQYWGSVIVMFGLVCLWASSASAGPFQQRLMRWLDEPGTKLVAVEFYSDYCEPCKEAAPKWERLRRKYKKAGLKLVVVNIDDYDSDKQCKKLPWKPDAAMCRPEMARELGVHSVPQAFLWSWQGNVLVEGESHVTEVARAIERYLADTPRVIVEAVGEDGQPDTALRRKVESELGRDKKVTVVTSKKDREVLRKLAEKSQANTARDDQRCPPGAEVSPNMRLLAERFPGNISLSLQSIGSSTCAAVVSAETEPDNPGAGVQKAVYELMSRLKRRPPNMPSRSGKAAPVVQSSRAGGMGTLRLEVDESGTRYTVDGTDLKGTLTAGQKEVLKLPLRVVPYTVVFNKKGFLREEVEVLIDDGSPVQRISHQMMRDVVTSATTDEQGFLVVKSDPENAQVLIDGVVMDRPTPDSFEVKLGPHAVRVRRKSYLDWTGEVTVTEDGASLNATLKPDFAELTIVAQPSNAQIFLNGQSVGVGRYTKKNQPSGGYALRIQAPQHQAVEKDVFVEAGKKQDLDVKLVPRFGVVNLTIRTEVEDKGRGTPKVFVDGSPAQARLKRSADGASFTGRLKRVSSGERSIEVQLPRFKSYEASVTVTDGGTAAFEANLRPRFGTLSVTSEPSGLPVRVNGKVVGNTPLEHDEDMGTHTIEVRGESYHRPFKKSVLLREKMTETLHAALPERLGKIVVASSPPDAEIFLDGVRKGVTPLNLKGVRIGLRRVEARRDGYTPTVLEFEVREGQTTRKRVELQSLGAIEVRCLAPPEDKDRVRLSLDGMAMNTATHRFVQVATGKHQVVCLSPRGHSARRQVDARPGHEAVVELDLTDPGILVAAYEADRGTYQHTGWGLIGTAFATGILGSVAQFMSAEEDAKLAAALLEFGTTTDGKAAAAIRIDEAQSARKTYEAVAISSFIVSGLTLIGSVVSFSLSPDPPPEIEHLVYTPPWELRFGATPSRLGVGMTFALDGRF